MRLILLFALIGFFLPSSLQANTVLVVGDSISAAYGLSEDEGWVRLAEQQLQTDVDENVTLVNASISGDTTEGALRRLPKALERFQPNIVVIELGGNDGLRGYSLKKMQANLEELALMSNNAGAQVLILGMRIPANYGPVFTERFAHAFVEAANNTGAELLPFLFEPIATDTRYFQSDGIHPTAEAQSLLAENILTKLQPMLTDMIKSQQ